MNVSSVFYATNFSTAANGTPLISKVFVYAPMKSSTKLSFLILLVFVGIIGCVGNILVLCFLKSKKRKTYFTRTSCFEKNFHVYIKSLAISDVLCEAISLPPICCRMYFDVFSTIWGCRTVRYLNFVFPSVTMNNLLFISIERYFSTRQMPRTFRHSTVKRIVIFAWMTGIFVAFIPSATYTEIRIDLNDTHYTVVCKYDKQYLPFRMMFFTYIIIQYIIPACIIIRINISLMITLWTRLSRRKVEIQQCNALKTIRRAAIIRGTSIIVMLTFAFVLPYIFYFTVVFYNMATQNTSHFERDSIIRAASVLLVYSNGAINVIIYTVQMKDFRTFLKRTFTDQNENQEDSGNQARNR